MQGKRRTKVGRVVSDKMDMTVVVSVERLRRHPIYKRVVRLSSKFKAHDQDNSARVGDTVRIEESRPLSREKRWTVVEIVEELRGKYDRVDGDEVRNFLARLVAKRLVELGDE